jgi:VIT1/CCC1 family predicted Fe2+/Mn2+ transporter
VKHSIKTGLTFGATSGIITTLGLMVGLHSGTHSRLVVMGGIITIAIADAFSDALGIHVSEEAENRHSTKEIWESTISTFFCKFIVALAFIIPVYFLELATAIALSVVIGLLMVSILSYKIAIQQKEKNWKIVSEHLAIAILVIVITHFVGDWVSMTFG